MPSPPLLPEGDRPQPDASAPPERPVAQAHQVEGPPTPPGSPEQPDAVPVAPSLGVEKPAETAEVLVLNPLESSDDSPTIISRTAPRPVLNDNGKNADLRGQHLAHFELLEPIGVGGMAAVIRARDLQLDRCVALKILPPEMANDPENILRFQREARSAARLDHENIARVFFCGEDQSLHFIAFEFVEGENLRTIIERRGPLPVRDGIHYLLQIATGLVHAAERGVIHRDIKPSNIIISPNGRAKLVDMGLARSLETPASGELTQSGVTLGTFDYISPEQALEPREADIRSDIYSLGCTFYHALTGQPPVPEGTAAKKLHHHQNVLPLDPRQLNPEIPDEVAAILARMMAKDPKDRYQRPEQLVQHLMIVAQKLHVGPETSSGVLYIEAPLPGPPRARPVLVAVLAVAALVSLIVLLGQRVPEGSWSAATGTARENKDASQPPPAVVKDDGPRKAEEKRPDVSQAPPVPVPSPELPVRTVPVTVEKPDDLQKVADAPTDAKYKVFVNGVLDLTTEKWVGIVFKGKNVVIQPSEGASERPVIRLRPPTQVVDNNPGVLAALTAQGGSLKVQGIRFETDAGDGTQVMAAIRCYQGGHVTAESCEFIQLRPGAGSQLKDVQVEADPGASNPTTVVLNRCLFLAAGPGGADPKAFARSSKTAVAVTGPAKLTLQNCAFGPHTAAVSLAGPAEVALSHCSALLNDDSAVFQVAAFKGCKLKVNQCLFSRPISPADSATAQTPVDQRDRGAVLIRQTDPQDDDLPEYEGTDNRYHNLAIWVKPQKDVEAGHWDPVAATWEAFQTTVRGAAEKDKSSQEVATNPWDETQKDLLGLLDGKRENIRQAFRVNLESPELRCKRVGRLDSRPSPVGLLLTPWDRLYGSIPEIRKPESVTRKKRTFDPRVKETANGVYRDLLAAIRDSEPGDVILIRYDGLLAIDPIPLEKPSIDLTLQPDENCRPVLTVGETADPNPSLFRLHDGKLRLENLQFRLFPTKPFGSQSVVTVAGDGQCSFRGCVLTLEPNPKLTQPVALAAVVLADPGTVMNMKTDKGTPRTADGAQVPGVQFEDCFIRGEGAQVTLRASRPLNLTSRNTLTVLNGSLLVVEPPGEKSPAPASDAAINVSLSQTTTYLTRYLLHLKAGTDVKLLVPVRVDTTDCLFLPAGSDSRLVYLDGADLKPEKWKLTWHGGHNGYGNFSQLLDQLAPAGGMMSMEGPYGQEQWQRWTAEEGSTFKARLQEPLPASAVLSELLPIQFKAKTDSDVPAGFGVNLDTPLPRPWLLRVPERP
jgi:serine/threonine protein kinase